MILRMSSMFLRTLREDPADAEVPSHRLLVRAGYLRRVSPGIYTWLPLGKRLLDRVTAVIRAEMDAAGGQELLFPALLPREVYERSGRAAAYGDDLFRLTDRRGAPHVLGPTHEEMFALQVKAECSSHRDLPVLLYQVQTKYRDEQRPRAGALRGREFLMKDAYSFDLDAAGMADSYARMREAYRRIFDRLGLEYRIVAALPGAMGGAHTEEFLATSPVGEDTFVSCTGCEYAANVEALRIRPPAPADPTGHPPLTEVATPGAATVAAVAAELGVPAASVLKNLLVRLCPPGGKPEIVAVGVPGDREVDLRRLEAAVFPATVEMVTAEDFADRPDLVRGYVGPQGLAGVRYLADPRVAPGTAWVTGANRVDVHARDVVVGRDFTVDRYVDVAEVREGDPCPRCGAALAAGRGIEIGQIFQLGRHFTDLFEVEVLGQDGTPVRPEMGCYGIGISRAAAAVAEQTHDGAGLCWPASIAPADVHLVAAGRGDGPAGVAERVAGELAAAGLDVLYDDRTGVSAGVKFTDAELIGVPAIVVVGRRAGEGVVEVRDRRTGERRDVPIPELLTVLRR